MRATETKFAAFYSSSCFWHYLYRRTDVELFVIIIFDTQINDSDQYALNMCMRSDRRAPKIVVRNPNIFVVPFHRIYVFIPSHRLLLLGIFLSVETHTHTHKICMKL